MKLPPLDEIDLDLCGVEQCAMGAVGASIDIQKHLVGRQALASILTNDNDYPFVDKVMALPVQPGNEPVAPPVPAPAPTPPAAVAPALVAEPTATAAAPATTESSLPF